MHENVLFIFIMEGHTIGEFDYRRWDAQDWHEFARLIGLSDYAAVISQNFVSTLELHRCRQQHLVQMGIRDFEHQKFLMSEIKLLFRGEHPIQIQILNAMRNGTFSPQVPPPINEKTEIEAIENALKNEDSVSVFNSDPYPFDKIETILEDDPADFLL